MTSRRPVIGIVTYGRDEEERFHVPAAYVECVLAAGGQPVLLAPEGPWPEDLMPRLGGLLLTGGGDIEPARYGGRVHPHLYLVDPRRDAFDLAAVRAAIARGLPMLCVCRGMQMLNVALGGSLIAHLPDVVGERVRHRDPERGPVAHRVTIGRDTRLWRILGAESVEVSSRHHQGLDRLADGLVATAWAADGVVEAVELPGHPWAVGVQWHPEQTALHDPVQMRLFQALVDAVGKGAEIDGHEPGRASAGHVARCH